MSLLQIERDGALIWLRLDRPEARNPIGRAGDAEEIEARCNEINADQHIRCAVLTGNGPAFSAGGDLKAMRDRSGAFAGGGPEIREGFRQSIHRMVRALYNLEVPLIAAINGPAIGLGCDLALLADIRIASTSATFGAPFVAIGLVPGDGGAWLLPRAIGGSRAAELLFSAKTIDAVMAAQWGLISRGVPPDALLTEAAALAHDIARHPSQALRLTKALMRQAQRGDLSSALEASAAPQALLCLTEDHHEAVTALLEGRRPLFQNR